MKFLRTDAMGRHQIVDGDDATSIKNIIQRAKEGDPEAIKAARSFWASAQKKLTPEDMQLGCGRVLRTDAMGRHEILDGTNLGLGMTRQVQQAARRGLFGPSQTPRNVMTPQQAAAYKKQRNARISNAMKNWNSMTLAEKSHWKSQYPELRNVPNSMTPTQENYWTTKFSG